MTMKLDRPLQLRSHLSGGAPAARADAATPLEIVDPWRGDLAATLECGGDSSVATAVQSAKAAYRSNGGQTRAQRAQWLEKAADLIADSQELLVEQIGRAHVWTPVTNAHLVCSLLIAKEKHITSKDR